MRQFGVYLWNAPQRHMNCPSKASVGRRKQEMKGPHSGLSYMVCGAPGLVQAMEGTWPLLGSSGIFFLLHRKLYTDAPDQAWSNQFCYQDGPEDWKLSSCHSSALWDLRQGQSEAEASALPEWVQIAMAKPIGMIRDQESHVTTFCFTLYCADTGHNTGCKTFEKEFFFISHIIMRRKWANNKKKKRKEKKESTITKTPPPHSGSFYS